MGIGEAEIAADRADVAHPNVCRPAVPSRPATANPIATTGDRSISRWVVVAPIRRLPFASIPDSSRIPLRSTRSVKSVRPSLVTSSSSVPPQYGSARAPSSPSNSLASPTVFGRCRRKGESLKSATPRALPERLARERPSPPGPPLQHRRSRLDRRGRVQAPRPRPADTASGWPDPCGPGGSVSP